MVQKYEEMEWVKVDNFKGGEKFVWMKKIEDDLNRILLMKIPSGGSVGYHQHEGSSEIIYFLEGEGTVKDGEDMIPVKAGMMHYCPEGSYHSVINSSDKDLKFFAIVPFQTRS